MNVYIIICGPKNVSRTFETPYITIVPIQCERKKLKSTNLKCVLQLFD